MVAFFVCGTFLIFTDRRGRRSLRGKQTLRLLAMKSRHSLGEIRLLASEICFASEIFANAKVIGNNISNKGDQWSPFFVGVVVF